MKMGQACRPCRGSCSLIPGRGCFGDLLGDEIVASPPSQSLNPSNNTAATTRQGLRKGAHNKVLKEKLFLNWTGLFKIIAVGPSPAHSQPDGRPLGDTLLYLGLPSNMSGPAAKPRVTVVRCKPFANPHDANDMSRYLPAGLTQYVLHTFATKSPPYYVTTDDVATPPILLDVA